MVHYNIFTCSFTLILLHQCDAARPRGSRLQNLLNNDQEPDVVKEQRHVGQATRLPSRWSRRKGHSNLELIAASNASQDSRRETRQKKKDFEGSSSDSSSTSSGSSSAPQKEDLEKMGLTIKKGVAFMKNGQAVADLVLAEEEHNAGTLEEMRDLILKHVHCATDQREDCEVLAEDDSSSSDETRYEVPAQGPARDHGPVQRFENDGRYVEQHYVERPVQQMENGMYRMEHRVEDGMMGTLPQHTGPWPPFGIFGCGKECKSGASSLVQDGSATGINIGGGEGIFKRQLDGVKDFMQRLLHLAFTPVQELLGLEKRQQIEPERVADEGGHSAMNEATKGSKKTKKGAEGTSSLLQTIEGDSQHGLSEVSTERKEERMTSQESASRSPYDLVSPTTSAPRGSMITHGNVCITLGCIVAGIVVIIYAMKQYSPKPPQKCSTVDDGYTHEPSVEPDFEPEPDPEC